MSDPLLCGHNDEAGLVAADLVEKRGGPSTMALFFRRDGRTERRDEPLTPFILVADRGLAAAGVRLEDCPSACTQERLEGSGVLNRRLDFESWQDCARAAAWLSKATGESAGSPTAPYLFINDPVRQHLTTTGRTLFKGMRLEDVRRMQVDIECVASGGFEFCNAEREGDRIVAIALSDESGWAEVLSGAGMDEKTLLGKFVETVRRRDPDIIEGHNIFNFDLPYIAVRAKRCRVKLQLGRDDSTPTGRPSRLNVADRTIAYTRFDLFGRHIVDTFFLVQAYDVAERALESFGLKEVARHFGVAAPNRTYIEGSEIAAVFAKDPERLMRYAGDDVAETRAVSTMLLPSYFVQTQLLPYSCQNVCVRGNATKIDALMLREYLRLGHAVPRPEPPRPFAGGYTDMFFSGVARNVHHCDVRSLYPSLMLSRRIGPRTDELGVFLRMLELLRTYRLEARAQAQKSSKPLDRRHYEALQATFKILINSFYGYLGFSQGQFNDFTAAETVTAEGRSLLRRMIDELRSLGAQPVEIDTDGIYFVPPACRDAKELERFREKFAACLPKGIEVEFDGEYKAMYSYKMKNYALLSDDGAILIRGAALKSRGLEPFQRSFLRRLVELRLEGREDRIPALKAEYEDAIVGRKWPIAELAKTVTLQDSLATYAAKIGRKGRGRDAAYELAVESGRDYRPGDQLTYYVTGDKKSVAAHEFARPVSEWDSAKRDENVAYYVAKLDALYAKFYSGSITDESETGGETPELGLQDG